MVAEVRMICRQAWSEGAAHAPSHTPGEAIIPDVEGMHTANLPVVRWAKRRIYILVRRNRHAGRIAFFDSRVATRKNAGHLQGHRELAGTP
jgi:hypothetical protein